MEGAPAPSVVAVERLSKSFGATKALRDVDLDLRPGEVHALVGHNGSGKSTLVKLLAGVFAPDRGSVIRIGNETYGAVSPELSKAAGLRFVHQNLGLINQFDVGDNLGLAGGYMRRGGLITWRRQRDAAQRLMASIGVDVSLRAPVASFRPVERTAVALARALDPAGGPITCLFLDEPTAALPVPQVSQLFDLIAEVRRQGVAILYVSHRLAEVSEIADRVTVLRDGRISARLLREQATHSALVEALTGEAMSAAAAPLAVAVAGARSDSLVVEELQTRLLKATSFSVREGEIVGIAGLPGSGAEEILPGILSTIKAKGSVHVCREVMSRRNPVKLRKAGLVMVPAPQGIGGVVRQFTLRENVALADLGQVCRAGLFRRCLEDHLCYEWLERLDIRPSRPELHAGTLSGGNRQKVALAKCLAVRPKVLLLEEPTAGVDVGARRTIHDILRTAASTGTALVVASTDLDELSELCTRILVVRSGTVVTELTAPATVGDIVARVG